MSKAIKHGVSRRGFLAGLTAGGAAAAAVPASAAPPARPSLRPGPHAPVRALHGGVPYWDFTGRVPEARKQMARPQTPVSGLTAEQQYLMGAW